MAIQSGQDRTKGWATFMAQHWPDGELADFLKQDGQAAYNTADQWASDMAPSYNSALPQPFRGAASNKLKALLLVQVISDRWKLGLFT